MTKTGSLEVRQVRPRDIKILKRPLTEERDNTALAVDMAERGQLEPVIIVAGTVIDGNRRASILRVAEKAGDGSARIEAVFPQTGDQLLAALPTWREKRELGYSWSERPFDFIPVYNALTLMYQADSIETGIRLSFTEKVSKTLKVQKGLIYHTRVALKEFGDGKDPGTPRSRAELAKVARGELGAQQFMDKYRGHALNGDITAPSAQRAAFTAMLGSLAGISSSIKTLGPLAKDLSAEEVAGWIKQLRVEENMIRRVIRTLERANENYEQ